MNNFDLLPIDWTAIAAIATFFAVAAAFWSQWEYRRKEKKNEKRELIERIIIPLLKNLNDIDSFLQKESRYIKDEKFVWKEIKKEIPHIVSRLKRELYEKIEIFSNSLEELRRLTNEIQPDLYKIIKNVIHPIVDKINILKGNMPQDEYKAIETHLSCDLDGQHFGVELYTLIIRQKSWGEFLTEMAQQYGLENKRRTNEQISVPTLYNLTEFEKIMSIEKILNAINEKINSHPKKNEIRNYFEKYNILLKQSSDLKTTIEDFVK